MIFSHAQAPLYFAFAIAFGLAMPAYAQVEGSTEGPRAGAAGDNKAANEPAGQQGVRRSLKDPIELCEKLAGVEREICLRQAQENRERPGGPRIGATPGSGGIVTGGPAASKETDPRR
jgi:hypothetical protein